MKEKYINGEIKDSSFSLTDKKITTIFPCMFKSEK
jgi:hypothetical protein